MWRAVSFALLVVGLFAVTLDEGGENPLNWNICLLLVGAAAATYLIANRARGQSLLIRGPLMWLLVSPVLYVGFQLLPLPFWLLRILSPQRTELSEALKPLGLTAIFAPISIHPATTQIFLLRTLAYSLIALLICKVSRDWKRQPWIAVIPLMVVAGFQALLGILQAADGAEVRGAYRSRDHFAGLLEMGMPLALACGLSVWRRSDEDVDLSTASALKSCLAFAVGAMMLVALIYSLSKMGFAAGLAGLFFMAVLAILRCLRGSKRWLAVTGLSLAGGATFAFLPTDQLASAYTGFFSDDPATLEGRAPVWNDSRHLLLSYPIFGTGLGTYGTAFLKYQTANADSDFSFAHNDYLELASELGAFGFLISGALFLMVLAGAVRASWSKDRNIRFLGLGCAGGLAAIGVHSLADFNLYIPANALFLSWIVGIAVYVSQPHFQPKTAEIAGEQARRRAKRWRSLSASLPQRVALVFSCLLIIYATGWIVFETKYKEDPTARRAFCGFGICDIDTVLAATTVDSAGAVSMRPPAEIEEIVKSGPAVPYRWCDLGDGFVRTGHVKEARYCYSRALELAPNIPPVLFRCATFYHAVHDDENALRMGVSVLQKSEVYREPVFDWYKDQKFAVNEILCRGLPRDPRIARAYLQYWIDLGDLSKANATWDWVLSHHYANAKTASDYIDFLAGAGHYQEASNDWATFLGDRRDGYREANWVFNGDFEAQPSGALFDWKIEGLSGQVEAALDPNVAYTGTHSLRVEFAGTENVNYAGTVQETVVPAGSYRFSAYIRTKDITTDRGVGLRIFDPQQSSRLDVKTDQFAGTTDGWKRVEQNIRVPSATKVLAIQVVREPTFKFDNKVSGTAWIDNVSLSRID